MAGDLYDKVYSDNPFVDELIYYVKQIGPNCIVKDENQANNNETLKSLQESDIYLACFEGRATFDTFNSFPLEVLRYSHIPETLLESCLKNKYNIPDRYRPTVVSKMTAYYLKNYEEQNNYYRMLIGYPNVEDKDYIYLSENMISDNFDVDFSVPIHLQPDAIIKVLENNGELEKIKQSYPDKIYLNYLAKSIDIYSARLAYKFQLLYMPSTKSDVINAKFKEKYALNRDYILRTVYSEAFKLESDYYDNVMIILIILQTMIDIIGEVQEHIARKDVFDERCIRYIFKSYGVPYYNEIPIKYQIAMMKNLNTLLKFKSTSRCMLDICSLFGFDNVRIFKYFLLRDRKLDANGEYQFNYKKETIIHKGEPITEIRTTIIITDEVDTVTVPFPFEGFMEKGNVFVIKIDNSLLSSDDYTLIGDQLTFKNPGILHNANIIEFIFYYNEEGQDQEDIDTTPYAISIESSRILLIENQLTYQIDLPEEFSFDHGMINIIIGSTWVYPNRYNIDDTGKLTFLDKIEDIGIISERFISILFIYSKKYNLHTKQIIHTVDRNTSDIIPETPTVDYFKSGNSFFMNIGSTLVSQERYGVTNKAILFLDSDDKINKGRAALLNYIYGDFETPNVITEEKSVIATEVNQRKFTIPFPFENYLEEGYQMYVRVGLTNLYDYQYEVFKNEFIFADASIYVAKGQSVHFTFIYPKDKSIDKFKPVFIKATTDMQRDFIIPFPYPKYLERNNIMIVQYNGKILDPSRYEIDNDKLHIFTIKDSIALNDEILFCFYYRINNKHNVAIKQTTSTALVDKQTIFPIEFPFFNYLESGNGLFVTIGSTFIDSCRYEIRKGTLFFTDETALDIGRNITFNFIYNTIYKDYDKYVNSETSKSEISSSGDNASVEIPWPYPNFLEDEGNSMIIVVGGHIIEPTEYDIFENRLYFANLDYIIENYGTTVRFEFHYSKITEETILVDDNQKNYDLKFVKVPLTEDLDTYIKNKSNYLDYDTLTLSDPLWDGEFSHKEIKNALLDKEFSYLRTKFISIDNIRDMTNIMLDMPYFFNLLFDDVKLEERLVIPIPYIHKTKNFKLNDAFVFLNILSFEYNNLNDDILHTLTQVMYVKGFNFRADIATLQTWIHDKMAYPIEDTHIKDFMIYKTNLKSYKQLLEIFKSNIGVYEFVTHAMYQANNKHEYDVFKKIYDSCLCLKYSKKFFTVQDGTGNLCKTYAEFLKYRDKDLYNLVQDVRAIPDDSSKKFRIIELIDQVVRSIQEYIDSDEYEFIFAKYPGKDTDAIKHYVELMVNFFKSYKVELTGINTILTFDDRFENMIRPIDGIELYANFIKDEYIIIKDSIKSKSNMNLRNYIDIKDKIYISIYNIITKYLNDNVYLYDEIANILVHFIFKDLITETIQEKIFDMQVSANKRDFVYINSSVKTITNLISKDVYSPYDKIFIKRISS